MSTEQGSNAQLTQEARIRTGLQGAYLRLLEGYARWGGWRYYGWTHQRDRLNYYGPAIWSEADCVHRFALELEREFPGQIHTELKISKALVADYDPRVDPRQAIDIVVSDFEDFTESQDSQNDFRTRRHEAFIEAKWLKKGRWTKAGEHLKRATDARGGIGKDLANLERALHRGRCLVAGMLVFDDEGFLDHHADLLEWPSGVQRLVVSPTELKRHGLGGAELEARLHENGQLHAERCACTKGELRPLDAPSG